MDAFDRKNNDPMNVKPYLPMLISDEKEVIMEHLEASRKQAHHEPTYNGKATTMP